MRLTLQAGLLTLPPFWRPSHPNLTEQWHTMAKRAPLSLTEEQDYSGGPVPDFHGVPY